MMDESFLHLIARLGALGASFTAPVCGPYRNMLNSWGGATGIILRVSLFLASAWHATLTSSREVLIMLAAGSDAAHSAEGTEAYIYKTTSEAENHSYIKDLHLYRRPTACIVCNI